MKTKKEAAAKAAQSMKEAAKAKKETAKLKQEATGVLKPLHL